MRHLVFAGSYRQALEYAISHDWGRQDWSYISKPEQLMGLEGKMRNSASLLEVHRVGDWWTNPNSGPMEELSRARGLE